MKTIHDTPTFRLDGRTTDDGHGNRTVELFQTFPLAQHPRSQRILCLTLPPISRARLAALIGADTEEPV